jgi:hypothetical protein
MSASQDKENAVKAEQAAGLLVADLRDLVKTDCPLLNMLSMQALNEAVMLQRKILSMVEAIQSKNVERV